MTESRQRITAIEQQVKHPERRSIFVDGKFALGVGQEIVLRLNLKVGQEITEQRLGELVKTEVIRKAKESAYNLLSYRSRSENELRRRLTLKQYPEDVVDQVIVDLKDLDLINDARFSQDWVESRVRVNPVGKARLTWELRQKGVELPVITEATEAVDPETEEELAFDLVRNRMEKMRDPDDFSKRRRLTALLHRRGFSWETIRKVMDKFIAEEDSPIE